MNEAELRSTFHTSWDFFYTKTQTDEFIQSVKENLSSKKIVILNR